MDHKPLLEVRDLSVSFRRDDERIQAVRGISFSMRRGDTLAIVGESGCGKSVTAQTLMRLLPESRSTQIAGQVLFENSDLLQIAQRDMEKLRGGKIGMIFQDPMTSLNPTLRIGDQIEEVLQLHTDLGRADRRRKALDLLKRVGISDPAVRARQYPHQFSGGMRQRVVIAIGMACEPQLLIADEPTTALDVTVQAQILRLMRTLQSASQTSVLLITHDLGVVASFAKRVIVMYAGQIMEQGSVDDIFYRPAHPYTRALLRSLPNRLTDTCRRLTPIAGYPPHLANPPPGCPFFPRCEAAMKICTQKRPEFFDVGLDHAGACHLHRANQRRFQTHV